MLFKINRSGNAVLLHTMTIHTLHLHRSSVGPRQVRTQMFLVVELDRIGFLEPGRIFNPSPERGMFSSIQCASLWDGWDDEITHCLVTLGDQPHVRLETLRTLLEFGLEHPDRICQPLRNGRRRHPVLFPNRLWTELGKSTAANLKEFLEQHANDLAGFESDDAGLDFDIDTPEDYERARRGIH